MGRPFGPQLINFPNLPSLTIDTFVLSEHLYNIVMNDDIKDLLCLLLVILVGIGFLSLLCFPCETKTDDVEVENVPVFHSNPDGTIDTYFYPVIH